VGLSCAGKYCQDNEISWVDWGHLDMDLLEFAKRLVHFRNEHPVFRRRRWFQGQSIHGLKQEDIAWFNSMGEQTSEELWGNNRGTLSLGIFINGENFPNPNACGEPVTDDSFYLIFNAHFEAIDFILPSDRWGLHWLKVLDTVQDWAGDIENISPHKSGASLKVAPRSLVLLQRQA
jgi:isoamylase